MTLKTQKLISALVVSAAVVAGLESLIYLLNINQPFFFLRVALYVYLFLAFVMAFLYDLHFKNPGALRRARERHESVPHWLRRGVRVWGSALYERLRHMLHWSQFRHFQNYLLLPALVYWGTVCLVYLNFGNTPLQQAIALLSSAALIVCYWYLKEIFHRQKERVDRDIFRVLSLIKLYGSFLLYAASLGITRYYCLETRYFVLVVFLLTFWLLYQAMFQYNLVTVPNLYLATVSSLILGLMSYFVYRYWGLNYFTAGVFLMAWYNFFWGILYHFLEGDKFSWRVFLELLIMTLLVSAMMFGVTNFKARIINAC